MAKTRSKPRQAPRSGRQDAPAHLALAEALAARGRREEAIALYEAAVRSDPKSARALRGLAKLLLAAGRAAEAFQRADAALVLSMEDGGAWALVAEALESLGERNLAAQAFERALALGEAPGELCVRLGRLYEALDRPQPAAAHYLRALAANPAATQAVEAHVAMCGLYGRAGQYALARAQGEAALRLDPDCRTAHQNLAAVCDHENDLAAAGAHRERAFRGAAVIVTLAPAPLRSVLTLASGSRANSPDRYLIPPDRYDRYVWMLAYGGARPRDCDVVFNAIADADAAAEVAPQLAAFLAENDRPLLNPPARIAATARDRAPELFAGLADLVVPEVRAVSARADLEGIDQSRAWLLRPAGSHGGERLERLTPEEAAARLDGRKHYLTAYRDFRSHDGLYRKYRMFFIDRVAFPYHMAAGEDWLLHYQKSLTPALADLIAEERAFLEDPRRALGAGAYAAVCEAGRRMDLDFAGIDFAVLPDGRALLFEANATMLCHPMPPDGPLAHKNAHVARIVEAFRTRLESV